MRLTDYCSEDYVEVREMNDTGRLIGRFCGNTIPESFEVWHVMWIKFRLGDRTADNDDDNG
jgi:hypothetical protein